MFRIEVVDVLQLIQERNCGGSRSPDYGSAGGLLELIGRDMMSG
jgi:hypothetical protein